MPSRNTAAHGDDVWGRLAATSPGTTANAGPGPLALPFHEERARRHDCWDRLFAVLVGLVTSGRFPITTRASSWAPVQTAPRRRHRGTNERKVCRTPGPPQLLPSLAALVRSGTKSLRAVDEQVHVEGLADCGPRRSSSGSSRSPVVSPAGAGGADRLSRRAGCVATPGESLVGCLDHVDDMVRAYAARALGNRYCDSEMQPSQPLSEFVTLLTTKEIERPGIAGPFFSVVRLRDGGLRPERAGVSVEDWFCTILAERRYPRTGHPAVQQRDRLLRPRVFGGRAGYVRDSSRWDTALALEAATEIDHRVEDMEPILVELGDSADAEICRRASWHLSYHYRRLHPAGAARGFVAGRALPGDADPIHQLRQIPSGRPALCVRGDDPSADRRNHSREATAAAMLEIVLPQSMRGDLLLPYGLPGDGGEPGGTTFDRIASARYTCGALLQFRGDVDTQRWDSIRASSGTEPAGAWRPEEHLNRLPWWALNKHGSKS